MMMVGMMMAVKVVVGTIIQFLMMIGRTMIIIIIIMVKFVITKAKRITKVISITVTKKRARAGTVNGRIARITSRNANATDTRAITAKRAISAMNGASAIGTERLRTARSRNANATDTRAITAKRAIS